MVRVVRAERGRDWSRLVFDNGIELEMPCEGELWSYLEFIDRVMVVLNMSHGNGCDQYRNIFCWRKEDGGLLWQVERARTPTGVECEGAYKNLKLQVRRPDGGYREAGIEEWWSGYETPEGVLVEVYLKPFRVGVDRLLAMTLEEYPCEVEVDYETGAVRFLALHQKV